MKERKFIIPFGYFGFSSAFEVTKKQKVQSIGGLVCSFQLFVMSMLQFIFPNSNLWGNVYFVSYISLVLIVFGILFYKQPASKYISIEEIKGDRSIENSIVYPAAIIFLTIALIAFIYRWVA